MALHVLLCSQAKSHDATGGLSAAKGTFESSSLSSSSPKGPLGSGAFRPASRCSLALAAGQDYRPKGRFSGRSKPLWTPFLANQLRAIKQTISASLADVVKACWRKDPQHERRQTQVSLHSFLFPKKARIPFQFRGNPALSFVIYPSHHGA